jgi:hypothetical protein
MGALFRVRQQGGFLAGHVVREEITRSVVPSATLTIRFAIRFVRGMCVQMGLRGVPLNSEHLGGLDIAVRPRCAREHLLCLSRQAGSPPTPGKAFWFHHWPAFLKLELSYLPDTVPVGNVLDPSTQIVHIPAVSRTSIIPTPFQNEFPASPSPSRGATVQVCGLPCDFPGLPLVLDYPRGSRGPGIGRERKGSTFLGRSDMSDQNASRRDNLQASAGTRTRLGVRRLRDENPVGPPTAARYAAKS